MDNSNTQRPDPTARPSGPSGAESDSTVDPGQWTRTEAGPGPGATAHPSGDPTADRAKEVAEKLKPVAVAAEEAAAKAVELSTKGLNKLSEMLAKRRQDRRDRTHGPN